MSTCGCICMFSLSCSSGYMSDLLVPFINKCNTKLCFKYIELLFLECEIIFREKKWQEWLRQNLNDRVLICINCLESFVEPGNRAKSGSKPQGGKDRENYPNVQLCSSQIEQQKKQERIVPERSARLSLDP